MSSGEPLFQEYFLMPSVKAGAIWQYSEAHRKPLHFHGHLEFILVKRGKLVERIGNRTYAVAAGQLAWHLPSVPHELLSASRNLELRVVHVEPDLACAVGRARGDGISWRDPIPRWARGSGPVSDAVSRWVRELGWLAAGNPVVELRRSDFDRLLEDCDSSFEDAPPQADPRARLSRLLQNAARASVQNRDSTAPNSLAELATCMLLEAPALDRASVCRLLDVSEGYLSRCFQKDLGVSLVAQRARIRVSRLVAHVERDGQNLLDAALSAGFGSYSQMHRTFSELVGMSPTAYLWRGGRQARATLTRRASWA